MYYAAAIIRIRIFQVLFRPRTTPIVSVLQCRKIRSDRYRSGRGVEMPPPYAPVHFARNHFARGQELRRVEVFLNQALNRSSFILLAELEETGTRVVTEPKSIYVSTPADDDAEGPNMVRRELGE